MGQASRLAQEEYISGYNDTMLYEDVEDRTPSNMSACSTVILSYAPPDVVRQAKLEAMEIKVRRKMLECKVSGLDTHALRDMRISGRSSTALRVCARTSGAGERELLRSLVVPPELTEHGEEVSGSSEVILAGERREYQRPAARGQSDERPEAAAGSVPYYRAYDPVEEQAAREAEAAAAAEAARRKRRGLPPAKPGAAAAPGPAGAGAGAAGGGPGKVRGLGARAELASQLSEGLLAFVPTKFERPQGVVSTAFVPQAQAVMEARTKYESTRQQQQLGARPASAPLRRSASMASDALGGLGGGGAGAGGSGAVTPLLLQADGGSRGTEGNGASVFGRQDKWRNVPMARVEEIDLLAIYRQNSKHLLAPQSSEPPPPAPSRGSSPTIRATIRTCNLSSSGGAPTATETSGAMTTAAGRGATTPAATATSSVSNSWRQLMPEPPPSGQGPGGPPATRTRQQRAASAAAAMAAASPYAVSSSPQRRNSASAAATTVSGAGGPRAPKTAWGLPASSGVGTTAAPRPSSAAIGRGRAAAAEATGATEQPWSARTSPATSGSSAAAACGGRLNPRPPSPSQRSPYERAAPASVPATSSGPAGGPAASAAGIGSPQGGFQAVDPETRRMRQNQAGGPIATTKTNRLRAGSARTASWGGGSSGGAGAPTGAVRRTAATSDGGSSLLSLQQQQQQQPAWATASSSPGGAEDRVALQQRILTGLARQYIATAGDSEPQPPEDAATAAATAAGTEGSRTSGTGSTAGPHLSAQSSSAQAALSDYQAQARQNHQQQQPQSQSSTSQHQPQAQPLPQRQIYHPPSRPQSAPSRRVRPPSAGSWAGRPDPQGLRQRSNLLAQHSAMGMVYDPEVQPGPLESYMNQLVGLD